MSNLVGAMPRVCAKRTVTGISTATTGVLFMKAEATMVPRKKKTMVRTGYLSALDVIQDAAASKVPVRTNAPVRMNIAAMVIGALLENTARISPVSIMPTTRKIAAPTMATTAGGKRSSRNAPKVAARMRTAIPA